MQRKLVSLLLLTICFNLTGCSVTIGDKRIENVTNFNDILDGLKSDNESKDITQNEDIEDLYQPETEASINEDVLLETEIQVETEVTTNTQVEDIEQGFTQSSSTNSSLSMKDIMGMIQEQKKEEMQSIQNEQKQEVEIIPNTESKVEVEIIPGSDVEISYGTKEPEVEIQVDYTKPDSGDTSNKQDNLNSSEGEEEFEFIKMKYAGSHLRKSDIGDVSIVSYTREYCPVNKIIMIVNFDSYIDGIDMQFVIANMGDEGIKIDVEEFGLEPEKVYKSLPDTWIMIPKKWYDEYVEDNEYLHKYESEEQVTSGRQDEAPKPEDNSEEETEKPDYKELYKNITFGELKELGQSNGYWFNEDGGHVVGGPSFIIGEDTLYFKLKTMNGKSVNYQRWRDEPYANDIQDTDKCEYFEAFDVFD